MTISMEQEKAFPSVEVKYATNVKPSKPTQTDILPLSTIDNDYYNDIPVHSVYVYEGRLDCTLKPADVIRDALSKALVYYYPFAGKLRRHEQGRLYVNCNSVGVPFVVSSANCELTDVNYIDGTDVGFAEHLVCDFPPEDDTGRHPMVLQVTTFLCGGFTLGTGISHALCDGSGAVQFFHAIAELASGKSEPSVKPVWERERLQGSFIKEPLQIPMDPAAAAVSPYLPTTDLAFECFHVDEKTIKRLKSSLLKESGDPTLKESSFTTVEALGAYVWRSKCKALKLNLDGETMLSLAVGVRKRLHPPLPRGYYGNAYLWAETVMKVKDLIEGQLSRIVRLVKMSKGLCLSDEFIRESLDYSETSRQLDIYPEAPGACTDITEWRQFGLMEEVDFGWKSSVNFVPASKNLSNDLDLCVIAPPSKVDPSMKDGVRVFIKLPRASMLEFRKELNALKQGSHA